MGIDETDPRVPPADGRVQSLSAVHPLPPVLHVPVAPTTRNRERKTIRRPLQAIACWRMNDSRFESGLSFLRPDARREIQCLRTLRQHHIDAKMSIFGHADPLGSDDDNKILAGRRASSMYGLLTRTVGLWEEIYHNPAGPDRWGLKAVQCMLAALSFPPGQINGIEDYNTQRALIDFQQANDLPTTGKNDRTTRAKLFHNYMDLLCSPEFRLTGPDFLGGGIDAAGKADYQGCGEFNAIVRASLEQQRRFAMQEHQKERDNFYSPNRRILILFFRTDTPFPISKWPCPRASENSAGCQRRFWSDHQRRRAAGPEPRLFELTQDTLACRFYHRLVQDSPCEYPSRPRRLRIHLHDESGKLMVNEPYQLTVDGVMLEPNGTTTAEGIVDHEVPPDAVSGVLQIHRHTWHLSLEDLAPHRELESVRRRLANLGYSPEAEGLDNSGVEFALWSLQHSAGVEKTGALDQATIDYLDRLHAIG